MRSRTLPAVAAALLMLLVSSYCAMECVIGPCQELQSAADRDVPPCHQQQPQNEDSERCLHPQFVVDTHPSISVLPGSIEVQPATLLPAESSVAVASSAAHAALPVDISPPPLVVLELSTVLRV